MNDNSIEITIATSLAIASLGASLALLVAFYRAPEPQTLLIYDNNLIASQAQIYVEAGQNPLAVIDAAVGEAIARGHIVIDARDNIKGPVSAYLQLTDFVAIGGSVGREQDTAPVTILPGTTPIPSSGAIQPATSPDMQTAAPLGDDAEAFARQLYGRNLPNRAHGAQE